MLYVTCVILILKPREKEKHSLNTISPTIPGCVCVRVRVCKLASHF